MEMLDEKNKKVKKSVKDVKKVKKVKKVKEDEVESTSIENTETEEDTIVKKLSPKEEMFCQEYIIDFSAKNAYLRTGKNNCKTVGGIKNAAYLMKKKCKWRIDELLAERAIRTEVDQDYVIAKLLENVSKCSEAQPVVDFKGKQVVKEDENGNRLLAVYKFDSIGRNRALELLGRHLGMFTDKVEVKGSVDVASVLQLARKRAKEQGQGGKE